MSKLFLIETKKQQIGLGPITAFRPIPHDDYAGTCAANGCSTLVVVSSGVHALVDYQAFHAFAFSTQALKRVR